MKSILVATLLGLVNLVSAQLSFEYQNTPVNEVIHSLSKLTGHTIVAPPLSQKVSLMAKNVSSQEALRILDTQLGLIKHKLHKENSIYVVRPIAIMYDYQTDTSELTTKVFQIRYANASQIANILKDVVGNAVARRNWNALLQTREPAVGEIIVVRTEVVPMIAADTFTNSVVVRGTSLQINEIVSAIQMMDVQVSEVYEIKVIHLRYIDASTAAMIVQQSMPVILGAQNNTTIIAYHYGNALVVKCRQTQWVHINNLIVAIDQQILPINSTTIIKTTSNPVTLAELLRLIFGG